MEEGVRAAAIRCGARILVVGLLAIAFWQLPLTKWIEDYISSIHDLGSPKRELFFVLGGAVFHTFSPTGYLPTILAGATFNDILVGWIVAYLCVTIGSLGNLAFVRLCCGCLARKITAKKVRTFGWINAMVKRYPLRTMLVFRIPYLWVGTVNYFFALSDVPIKIYVFGCLVGFIPGSFLFSLLGREARGFFDMAVSGNWKTSTVTISIVVTIITVSSIVLGLIFGRRAVRQLEAEARAQENLDGVELQPPAAGDQARDDQLKSDEKAIQHPQVKKKDGEGRNIDL